MHKHNFKGAQKLDLENQVHKLQVQTLIKVVYFPILKLIYVCIYAMTQPKVTF